MHIAFSLASLMLLFSISSITAVTFSGNGAYRIGNDYVRHGTTGLVRLVRAHDDSYRGDVDGNTNNNNNANAGGRENKYSSNCIGSTDCRYCQNVHESQDCAYCSDGQGSVDCRRCVGQAPGATNANGLDPLLNEPTEKKVFLGCSDDKYCAGNRFSSNNKHCSDLDFSSDCQGIVGNPALVYQDLVKETKNTYGEALTQEEERQALANNFARYKTPEMHNFLDAFDRHQPRAAQAWQAVREEVEQLRKDCWASEPSLQTIEEDGVSEKDDERDEHATRLASSAMPQQQVTTSSSSSNRRPHRVRVDQGAQVTFGDIITHTTNTYHGYMPQSSSSSLRYAPYPHRPAPSAIHDIPHSRHDTMNRSQFGAPSASADRMPARPRRNNASEGGAQRRGPRGPAWLDNLLD